MLSEEVRIEIVKETIKTEEGWNRLVLSLGNKLENKLACIELLKKIGENKSINVSLPDGYSITTNLSDVLVVKLEEMTSHIK